MSDIVRPDASAPCRLTTSAALWCKELWDDDPVMGWVLAFIYLATTLLVLGGVAAGVAGALGFALACVAIVTAPVVALSTAKKHVLTNAPWGVEHLGADLRELRKELRVLKRCDELPRGKRNESVQEASQALRQAQALLTEALDIHECAERQLQLLTRIASTLELETSTLVGGGYSSYHRYYEYGYSSPSSSAVELDTLHATKLAKLAEVGMDVETLGRHVSSYREARDAVRLRLERIQEIQENAKRVIHIQTTRNQQLRLSRSLGITGSVPTSPPQLSLEAGESLKYHLQGLEEIAKVQASPRRPELS